MQRNGIEVLSRIPGLLEHLTTCSTNKWHFYSVIPEDKGFLGSMSHRKHDGSSEAFSMNTYRRHVLQEELNAFADKLGIPVNWGYEMETLEQDEHGVSVTFANGVKESFSFVIGCDGLRSKTREVLFGEQPADYTGLCTVINLNSFRVIAF